MMTGVAVIPPKFPGTVIGTVQAVASWSRLPELIEELFACRVDWRLPWATGQSVANSVMTCGTGVALNGFGVAGPVPCCGSWALLLLETAAAIPAVPIAAPAPKSSVRREIREPALLATAGISGSFTSLNLLCPRKALLSGGNMGRCYFTCIIPNMPAASWPGTLQKK